MQSKHRGAVVQTYTDVTMLASLHKWITQSMGTWPKTKSALVDTALRVLYDSVVAGSDKDITDVEAAYEHLALFGLGNLNRDNRGNKRTRMQIEDQHNTANEVRKAILSNMRLKPSEELLDYAGARGEGTGKPLRKHEPEVPSERVVPSEMDLEERDRKTREVPDLMPTVSSKPTKAEIEQMKKDLIESGVVVDDSEEPK